MVGNLGYLGTTRSLLQGETPPRRLVAELVAEDILILLGVTATTYYLGCAASPDLRARYTNVSVRGPERDLAPSVV